MKVTVLGCGTSTGVPVIGCKCHVCLSDDLWNKRTRSSVLVTVKNKNLLIDTSTDLKHQAIANDIMRIDAVLYTHSHADHIHGIDDLRSFNSLQKKQAIDCYGDEKTINRIKEGFSYIFTDNKADGWKPHLRAHVIDNEPFYVQSITVMPLKVEHGPWTILGYRIGDFAYITDCSFVPPETMEKLKGVKVLIIDALRHKKHSTHYTVKEAVSTVEELKVEKAFLTHLGHDLDYKQENEKLPSHIRLAHDGLVVEI